jgi:tRNA threonylcarbamoyladenosine biosynthesis protein TsaE
MLELESSSPEETERIAGRLARGLAIGDIVTVAGELGAGKTTFIRGACRALGVTTPVTSPTYTIGNRYRGRVDVSHLDLYRFGALTEADWGDLEAYFEDAVTFVEWPDAATAYLPPPRVRVRLRLLGPEHRLIVLQNHEKSLQIPSSASC